jgi:hypothetical protein
MLRAPLPILLRNFDKLLLAAASQSPEQRDAATEKQHRDRVSAIDLRILGVAPGIPLNALQKFYPMMWLALAINAVTGVLMVIGYPTKQLTNPLFYIKLSLVGLGVWLAGIGLRFRADHVLGSPKVDGDD